jgi:hypothetical protein
VTQLNQSIKKLVETATLLMLERSRFMCSHRSVVDEQLSRRYSHVFCLLLRLNVK